MEIKIKLRNNVLMMNPKDNIEHRVIVTLQYTLKTMLFFF